MKPKKKSVKGAKKQTPKKKGRGLQKAGLILMAISIIALITLATINDVKVMECKHKMSSDLCETYELELDKYHAADEYVNCLAPYNQIVTIKADFSSCADAGLLN